MKYAGNMNLSTLTRTSSTTPLGCFSDLSANWSVTVVGRALPNPNRLNIDSGMRLILAPRSHKAFSKIEFPIVHGIVKLPGSFRFYGSFRCRMALHSSVRFTISKFDNLLFLDSISFMNFTQLGIFSNALANGMFICRFLNTSRNLVNCLSNLLFFRH